MLWNIYSLAARSDGFDVSNMNEEFYKTKVKIYICIYSIVKVWHLFFTCFSALCKHFGSIIVFFCFCKILITISYNFVFLIFPRAMWHAQYHSLLSQSRLKSLSRRQRNGSTINISPRCHWSVHPNRWIRLPWRPTQSEDAHTISFHHRRPNPRFISNERQNCAARLKDSNFQRKRKALKKTQTLNILEIRIWNPISSHALSVSVSVSLTPPDYSIPNFP